MNLLKQDLDPSFEFLTKEPENAPYLKHLHCFNYGVTLSHGLLKMIIHPIKHTWMTIFICAVLFANFSHAIKLHHDFTNLSKQDRALIRDLILLNYPPFDWRKDQNQSHPVE